MRLIDGDKLIEELDKMYYECKWDSREVHFSLEDMRCNIDLMDGLTFGEDDLRKYVSIDAVNNEIQRFLGYLDQDMINRIHIALNKLPGVTIAQLAECYEQAHQDRLLEEHGITIISITRCPKCKRVAPLLNYCGLCGAEIIEKKKGE